MKELCVSRAAIGLYLLSLVIWLSSAYNARPLVSLGQPGTGLKYKNRVGGEIIPLSAEKNGKGDKSDKLYLSNRMEIRIGLPTKNHGLAAKFIEDEKKLLDATWEKGMYKVTNQKEKVYTLLFPPIVVPGVDTLSTSVQVNFEIQSGKIIMKSGDWSIRGKSGSILKDSNFMQTFRVEITGELSIRESQVIKASAVKAADIGVPAPPVVANGWVQYKVEGEKPRALRSAPPVVMEATVNLIKQISQDFATRQFKERFSSSFRSFLTSELSKQAVRKNIEAAKAKAAAEVAANAGKGAKR